MKSRLLAVAAAAALALAACAPSGQPETSTTTSPGNTAAAETMAASDGLNVSVAFYPIEFAATKVGGDRIKVSSLTTPGTEPHDLELTPQQIAGLDEADLVIYLGGFQPAVDKAVAGSKAKHKLDLATVIKLHPIADDHGHDHGDDKGHDHGDDKDHATEEGHDHADDKGHDHDHGDFDPHYWLDATMMATSVEAIAKELGEIDAANKDTYTANAKTATDELTALDEEYKQGLGSCTVKTIITSHAAFGYLTERYGLEQIGISGLSPNEQPSPARIAEVQEEAKEHGVTTIFFETLTSPEVAESIAGDLGLKTAVLDPLEGVTDESPGTDYPSIMKANLKAIQEANGCS
ncbi:metal ABC transporter substrate-binding protein [Arachnia propionica]|uniref:Zinc ABC transporter substrate-binding protein n=1 Tax=Arachnia propionica TaxID=1750 RepID=A0A3P1WXV2_9ACTN|nr:metal ABC transporter substrate-binding protein [Arachnia propionica]RRD50587.1 zinc ABC transporter substrate-binding protein [Arachnia propionica]